MNEQDKVLTDTDREAYDRQAEKLQVADNNADFFAKHFLETEKKLAIAVEALEEIANEDFRGNRSSGGVKAFHALAKIRGEG